jgi:hypothetical protein
MVKIAQCMRQKLKASWNRYDERENRDYMNKINAKFSLCSVH